MIHGFSSALLPRPADWPAHVHVTGYWFLPANEQALPPEVERFLADGEPPVLVAAGGVMTREHRRLMWRVAEALSRAGWRVVIQDPSMPSELPLRTPCLKIGALPHSALLTRLAAVVHHGGSGTVHMTLRARRPSLSVPAAFDQQFWSLRLAAAGASPPPLLHPHPSPRRLAEAVESLKDPSFGAAATRLGAAIEVQDGVGGAVSVIELALGDRQAHPSV